MLCLVGEKTSVRHEHFPLLREPDGKGLAQVSAPRSL